MIDKVIGAINMAVGISVALLSPVIAVIVLVALFPIVVMATVLKETVKFMESYCASVKDVMYCGFKISNQGVKRWRGTR